MSLYIRGLWLGQIVFYRHATGRCYPAIITEDHGPDKAAIYIFPSASQVIPPERAERIISRGDGVDQWQFTGEVEYADRGQ